MSLCSVVIVSFYTGPSLFATIKCALRQKQLAEVIIVNNENPPDILARLQQIALTEPRLKIITGQGNVGFAKSCNIGAKKATGDFILLLNPACLLPPDALVNCMRGFDAIPGAMMAGCWLEKPDGSERPGGRKPLLTPNRLLYESLGLKYLLPLRRFNPHEGPMPPETHEVPAISSDFMCIRAIDYNRLYGMDEGYFLHVEDADFCIRVRHSGGRIICVPAVRVTYMVNPDGKKTTRVIEWNRTKGYLRYFSTHFQGKTVPGMVILADMIVLARFALRLLWLFLSRPPTLTESESLAAKRLLTLATGYAELPESNAMGGITVLVTGATSHIGLCVVRRLLASGASVIAMSRKDPIPFRHERLRWVRGNLIEKPWNLDGYHVPVAVHCAPLWHLPPAIPVMQAAGAKRIIAFSSTAVFTKAQTRNAYEKKLIENLMAAEADIIAQCEERHIGWTILRPTMTYGGGLSRKINVLADVIRRFGVFPVYPPAKGKRQPVHADDLALAAMHVIGTQASYNKSYNISGGEVMTYRDMIGRIFQAYDKKRRIFKTTMLPFALDVAGRLMHKPEINGEIAHRMNDDQAFFHDEAQKDFGYSPRKFLSGGLRDIEGF